MAIQFKLPDLGENVASGTVVRVLVSKGDTVEEGQAVLEMETDKAVVEVPVDSAGTVAEVHVAEGDEASVGQAILTLEAATGDAAGEPEGEPSAAAPAEAAKTEEAEVPAPQAEPAPSASLPPEPGSAASATSVPATTPPDAAPAAASDSGGLVPAAPSVRRFAREIGIDIRQVQGTGAGGRISVDDVKAYARSQNQARPAGSQGVPLIGPTAPVQLPDFSQWGPVEREPMRGIRRVTAEHLSQAWATIPHVTQFANADITDLEAFRKRYQRRAEASGAKLTVTAILLKIAAAALARFPQFNASVDAANNEIIYKKYVHIGVAVDTPHGLLVPVIRDVDQKSLMQLSVELGEVAAKARDRKLQPGDMQGGTFTISNLGGIGGSHFTPIVNSPEVAILGVGRSQLQPVYVDGELQPRLIMPLALSYDHRLIDGADGARFITWLVEAVEHPLLLALEG